MTEYVAISTFKTPVGELLLGVYQDQLVLADWRYRKMRPTIDKRIQSLLVAEYREADHPLFALAKNQLNEYFAGERKAFDLPLLFAGTDFQQRVWQALVDIAYGATQTYLQLAKALGDEKAIRAVATANGANAISIIVPCHRIIGSDGSMVGYAGGTPAKKKLLKLEGALATAQMEMF